MVLPHQTQSVIILSVWLSFVLVSCNHAARLYTSSCNINKKFVHVSFRQLIDSISRYDQQYVEVSGKYEEDKGISALVCDSLFVDHPNHNALWINFSQDCPLYLSGTHQGFFEYNDGTFIQINNKMITIRGMVDMHNKGHLKQYKATIDRISLVKL